MWSPISWHAPITNNSGLRCVYIRSTRLFDFSSFGRRRRRKQHHFVVYSPIGGSVWGTNKGLCSRTALAMRKESSERVRDRRSSSLARSIFCAAITPPSWCIMTLLMIIVLVTMTNNRAGLVSLIATEWGEPNNEWWRIKIKTRSHFPPSIYQPERRSMYACSRSLVVIPRTS